MSLFMKVKMGEFLLIGRTLISAIDCNALNFFFCFLVVVV